jgi:hypothetical protein
MQHIPRSLPTDVENLERVPYERVQSRKYYFLKTPRSFYLVKAIFGFEDEDDIDLTIIKSQNQYGEWVDTEEGTPLLIPLRENNNKKFYIKPHTGGRTRRKTYKRKTGRTRRS